MTISIENETGTDFPFDYDLLANQVIMYTIEREDFPYEAEINLTLVDDEAIRAINQEYRQIDRATDVLSFPMISYIEAGDFSGLEDEEADNFNPDTGEILLGDIIISVPKVYAQAEEFGHSLKREFAFLIVHSMLHLFGYDHLEPEEAAFMENKQREILNEMNILR
jgi:probable rRNA maturation factor